MWHGGDWSTRDWTAMTLMMLLFWGGLIALVVYLARAGDGRNSRGIGASSATPTPDEVLAERFARGEIDEDEFVRRRAVLHGTSKTA
ncbi:SHOCT domain-containing protein [Sporichthya polymorpha]|uniref:SHOCT domain-containing protein n=1 Tax=Sporichthya polymorpha TaxID=35751 RepID=UPI000382DA42|nr:SHOCT domain-containing protein [Sporichthya polymorpha]